MEEPYLPPELVALILAIATIINPSEYGKGPYFFFNLKEYIPYLSEEQKLKLFINACKKGKKEALFLLPTYHFEWEKYAQEKRPPILYAFIRGVMICAKKGHTYLLEQLLQQSNFRPIRKVGTTINCQYKFVDLLHNLYTDAICAKKYSTLLFLRKFCDIADAGYITFTVSNLKKNNKMKLFIARPLIS